MGYVILVNNKNGRGQGHQFQRDDIDGGGTRVFRTRAQANKIARQLTNYKTRVVSTLATKKRAAAKRRPQFSGGFNLRFPRLRF